MLQRKLNGGKQYMMIVSFKIYAIATQYLIAQLKDLQPSQKSAYLLHCRIEQSLR